MRELVLGLIQLAKSQAIRIVWDENRIITPSFAARNAGDRSVNRSRKTPGFGSRFAIANHRLKLCSAILLFLQDSKDTLDTEGLKSVG